MEIKDAPFTLRGNSVDFDAEASPSLTVNVPKKPRGNGGGEHQDRFHPEQGTKNEDEEYGEWQEAFIVDVTKPIPDCTAHLYLKDGNYDIGAKVSVSVRNNQLSATIGNIRINRKIEVHKDGCDPSIFTTLLLGAIHGPLGIIEGKVLGDALNTLLVDQVIEPLLTRMLTSTTIRIGPNNLATGGQPRQQRKVSEGLKAISTMNH
jgi:hypothetical protein